MYLELYVNANNVLVLLFSFTWAIPAYALLLLTSHSFFVLPSLSLLCRCVQLFVFLLFL